MNIDPLLAFAEALKAKFALPGEASPEDQLKPHIADLLMAAGREYTIHVETRTETHLKAHKVRPDLAVYANGLICGYIELKAPGLGADAPRLKGEHNKTQWEKLKSLPNLIYTDGREWVLYRFGERAEKQPLVRLHDDPTQAGKAAITREDADALGRLLRDFLSWEPIVPHDASGLATYLAPLTRFLREEVKVALALETSAVSLLAQEWRQFFFPDADDAKFADAYAQTVTYAMLLARLSGASELDPAEAAKTLDKNNGLLARTLELLGQKDARNELSVGFEMLKRSLEALNPRDFLKSKPDLWLYFYEDFLAAYDPKLRKDYGVYYTPREVVELQVRLTAELLEKKFGKKLGFADDGVVFLDPAVGTGTYPVAAVKHGLDKVRTRSGEGAVPARARQMAENMHGFEVLVGPYAVAHLRLTQALEGAMNAGKTQNKPEEKLEGRLNIYLADTLSSPNKAPPGGLDLTHKALTQEHEAARKIKGKGDVLVCLGNPPYDRQQIAEGDVTTQKKGGWVRFGDQIKGGAKQQEQGMRPIFMDFTEPAAKAGAGKHIKMLYNDYVYFWRWALWRLFEQQDCGGIVTFITASSYLAGPGFVGMREVMRRTFDALYIIDLGGDNRGTRKTPNVFNIQTPVAIAIGVRGKKPNPQRPASVLYTKIEGASRADKLKQLEAMDAFDSIIWQECPQDWHALFLPQSNGDFFEWPDLESIFPISFSGVQTGRNWIVGETQSLLGKRVHSFVHRGKLGSDLKESRDTKIDTIKKDYKGNKLDSIKFSNNLNKIKTNLYNYRAFDVQFIIDDPRFCDWPRPSIKRIYTENQIFFGFLATETLANGQAILATHIFPDMNFFHGRGGRISPLYRNAAGTEPNITAGLLETLGEAYGAAPSAEDLAAYIYAVLGGQSYTQRFWNELETPGTRVPLTKDAALFAQAAKAGRKLIWLHCYGERFQGEGRGTSITPGAAKIIRPISDSPNHYPEEFKYNPSEHHIIIGAGVVGPVPPHIWEFEVSGLKVVQSWLGYRMKARAGKKSSPLDDIRPERWTAQMSDELLELLWVLEATLALEPQLEDMLDKIIASPCFKADDLPQPKPSERKPPDGEDEKEEDEPDWINTLTGED